MSDPILLGHRKEPAGTNSLLRATSTGAPAIMTPSALTPEGTTSTAMIGQHLSSSIGQAAGATTPLNGPALVTSSLVAQPTSKAFPDSPISVIASSSLGLASTSITATDLDFWPEATSVVSSHGAQQSTVIDQPGATRSAPAPVLSSMLGGESPSTLTIIHDPKIIGATATPYPVQGTSTAAADAIATSSLLSAPLTQAL